MKTILLIVRKINPNYWEYKIVAAANASSLIDGEWEEITFSMNCSIKDIKRRFENSCTVVDVTDHFVQAGSEDHR